MIKIHRNEIKLITLLIEIKMIHFTEDFNHRDQNDSLIYNFMQKKIIEKKFPQS